MSGKTPYLRQRDNGSWEYLRPIRPELRPYFDGYLKRSGSAIYRVFHRDSGKPEKDKAKVLPAYYRLHAEIEARMLDAEEGRIITHEHRVWLKELADKWLDWAFPHREGKMLLFVPPDMSPIGLVNIASKLSSTGELGSEALANRRAYLENIGDLRESIVHFLKWTGMPLRDFEMKDLEDYARRAYEQCFPFLRPVDTADLVHSQPKLEPLPQVGVSEPKPTLREMLERWREDKMPSPKAFQERQRSVTHHHPYG